MAEFDPKTARKVPGIGEFDPSTAQPYEPPKPASALRSVGDLGVKAAQGVAAGIPEMVIGAGNMLTGGKTGYVAQSLGFDTKKIREGIGQYLTPEQQAAEKAVQQAEGFVPTLKAVVQNPMAAVGAVAESIPVMVAGGVLGRAVAPGRFAGAVGEGAAMAGSQAEQIRQQTSDGLLTGKQSLIAAGTGLVGGALGAVGSKVAGRFGVGDVDSMIANGFKTGTQAAVKPGVRGLAERMVKGGISEGLFEEMPQSMVETGLQNYALDKDVTDGMGNAAAMGLVTGGLMGAGAGALTRGAKETPPADPTQPPMDPTQPAQGPQGEVLGLPAPAIVVGSDGTAQTAADRNARLQRMQSGDIVDVTPIRETMRPSVAMGINPADGPLSKAAAMAVDSGASPVVDPLTAAPVVQARNAPPQGVDPQALSSMSDADLRGYMRNAQDTSIRKAVSAELAKRKQAAVDAMPDPLQASVFDQPQGATNRGIETDQTQQAETQREAQDATRQGIGAGLTNPIVQGAQDDRIAATGVQRTDDRGNRDGRGDAGTSLPAGMGDAAAPDRRLAAADAELDTQGDAGDRPSGRTTGNPASLTPGNFTAQPTARMGEMTRATAGPGFTAADVMRPAASAEPITATNGDPFPSQLAAKRELNKQGLTNTHAITPAGEGFVLTPANVQDQQKGTDGILSAETAQAAPGEAPAPAGRDAAAIGGVPATPGAGDVQADGVNKPQTKEARQAAIDAETMETRNPVQVAQPTPMKRISFDTMTLSGPKKVSAKLYELPGYNGPQIAVSEYKTSRGTGYKVYLPKSGAFIHDSNGVTPLKDALEMAVLRIKNEREAIGKRATDLSKNQPKIDTSAKPAQETAKNEQVKKPTEPAKTEPFDYAGLKIRQTRTKVGNEVVDGWLVQSPENAEREARGERQIGGDRIVETREQAVKTAEQEVKRAKDERARKDALDREDADRKAVTEARKEANRGKTLLERRAEAILDKQIRESSTGDVITRREWVERRVKEGLEPKVTQEDKIKPMSRMQAFRADNRQQAEHDKKVKEAGKKDVYWLGDFEITKTEYDYVQKVKANPPAESKPKPEATPETAPTTAEAENTSGWSEGENGFTSRPVYRYVPDPRIHWATVQNPSNGVYVVEYRIGDKVVSTEELADRLLAVKFHVVAKVKELDAGQASHQDPGEKPEAATKGVVNESLKTAAKNEGTKPSEMRKWLLAEIDKDLLNAPDRADFDDAVKRVGEKDAISMYTGSGLLGKNAETGFITFDVPGDGKFKVRNSVRGLLEFRKNISASQGFKDAGQRTVGPEQNDGAQSGSSGKMAAINNMIDEGDFEAARDYAEAVEINLDDVKVPRGERKVQWDAFRKDGTLPPPVDTRPLPPQRTPAQIEEEKRQAQETEEKRPKDTGWNMVGTGYAGKRYRGRNITTDDGRQIVARVYENAGSYDEVEVKVDGVRKFTVNDRNDARGKADAFIKTLTEQEAELDLKGFTRTPKGNGAFELRDGNLIVSVEPTGRDKFQARFGSAKSSPHLQGEQGAVDWADNYRKDGKDDKPKKPAKVTPQISGNPEKFIKVAADSVRELRRQDVDRVLSETPVQFQMEVARHIKDSRKDLVDEVDEVMADMRSGSANPAPTQIPEGYKPAGEPFYRDGKLTQGYAPFDIGQRVTMKESGGQSGVIDLFTSPDKNGVFDGAMVKFDNGVEQIVKLNKLEAEAAPVAAAGTRREPTKVSMFNPYEDGDIVTIGGQDWTVRQDTPGWYLTNTGNWRGTHPTIRNVKAMADLIRAVEQADVAQSKPAEPEAETPRLTPAEAAELMEWQDLGQKDGVKTHILTFYESKADKDAKRGRMTIATITKGDRSATAWMVDGDDKTFGPLALAKKRGMEIGMAKAKTDGFVQMSALENALGADVMSRPVDKAAKLRKDADKLAAEARKMLEGIEPGQPIMSTRDRNLRERSMEKMRKAAELNAQADALDADKPAAPAQQEAQKAGDDRDTFTLTRLNRETNKMEPVTFKRGEYIRHRIGDKDHFGDIDGISQARREFSVDGLWYAMGFANKAERPADPVRNDMAPLSKVIDKVNAKNGEGLTDADRVPEQKPASKTPTVDRHETLMKSVREGKATAEQFKAAFESLVQSKAAVVAELETKTKAELLRDGGYFVQMRYANEKKGEIIDAVYRQMLGNFTLGETLSYGMGKGAYEAAVRRHVDATDDAKLEQYTKDRQAAIEEAMAQRAAKAAAMDNPQTLGDFKAIVSKHIGEGKSAKEAFLSLTPEQRIQYDTLAAESTKEAREARKRAQKTEVRAAGQTTGGEIIATKHTKNGYDLFVVQLSDRLSKEDYQTVLASAKRLGGWYSSFGGNGAVRGFQFKDKPSAEAFLKLAGGDTTAAQTQAQQRRDAFSDDRSQTAVERLREMADRTEEAADEEIGRERKTNTGRRARFASSALAGAAASKAMAKTMRNIAQAIEDGKAKFLDAVRTKTQVELLTSYVRTAKDNEIRSKHPSYADQEKRKGEPPTAETADFAEFPAFTAYRSDLATLARQMLEVDGTKKLGQKLMTVADDVSDAYLDFAKEPGNLFKLSTFSIKRGDEVKTAIFASRDLAERAIQRSGLTGKAIVLAEKRGVNRIIMSPSEAMNANVWTGDGDKRITLTADYGNELVEAIGRRGNKANGLAVPWQFQTAYDRRKALTRMGIETPSEFRSALREFIGLQEQAVQNKVREMELQMVGRKADGLDFFPTPSEIADQMVEAADIQPDMAVLEPSAGMGHIADRIRAAGAEPDVIEISQDRRDLLEEKGYHLAESDDFMAMQPRGFFTYGDRFRAQNGTEGIMRGVSQSRVRLEDEQGNRLGLYDRDELTGIGHRGSWSGYDRIIMNPPFSNRQDAEHVRHAYTLLKPGGRIVAIMGEGVFFGADKKAQEFRDWLAEVGGTDEKLPAGSFMDPSLPVNTGVNARMVVIDKPAGDVKLSIDGQNQPADTADYGTATQAHRDAAARFSAAFGGRLAGGPDPDLLDAVAPRESTKRGRSLASVAAVAERLFNREVVFVRFKGKPKFNGAVSKAAPGFIFLNIDSQKPLMAVLGHELLHEMAKSVPSIYANLSRRLDGLIKGETEYGKRLVDQYRKQGISLKGLDAREELEADIVGDNFMDGEFWNALAEKQPGMFRRIVNFVTQWLDTQVDKLAGYRPFGTDEFLTDIAEARAAVADAMRQFSAAEVGAVADQVDGDVKFSAAKQDQTDTPAFKRLSALLGPSGMTGLMQSLRNKTVVDGLKRNSKALSDLLESHPGLSEQGRLVDIPTSVVGHVVKVVDDEQIRRAVVAALPVDVVNLFGRKKLSPDQVLSNETMLKNVLSVNGASDVPLAIDKAGAKSLLRSVATQATELASLADRLLKSGPAGLTNAGDSVFRTHSGSVTETEAFSKWFGGSKVVDASGKPMRVFHGTSADQSGDAFTSFDTYASNYGLMGMGGYFTADPEVASSYTTKGRGSSPTVYPVFLSIKNPLDMDAAADAVAWTQQFDGIEEYHEGGTTNESWYRAAEEMLTDQQLPKYEGAEIMQDSLRAMGFDGITHIGGGRVKSDGVRHRVFIAFEPEQVKSATGNAGTFDPDNADIRFSLADAAPNDSRDIAKSARQLLQDTFKAPGKLNWWHKTVGTQWNLAQRVPEFKRVFDAAQDFLDDVSHYGAEASRLAPKIIPKLETWKDLGKSPISAEDNKAISAPIFEGTLTWGRDESGKPVKMADLEAQAAALSPEQKGQRLLRQGKISEGVLKMWKGLPADQFSAAIETRYASEMLKAGVVWSDAELKSIFKMTDGQIKLYREFRAATDKSLTDLAVADILQFAGKDVDPIKDAVLGQPLNDGAEMVRDYLLSLAEMFPERADTLIDTANRVIDKADRATDLMERGYAPLARFGRHTVYVTSGEEQLYFGMYENRWEAAKAERNLRETYPNAVIDRGVMSVEAYKQFQGISPETLELFGEMLGLEADGESAENKAFQTYLKLAKSNRSAMKRHIERKGVAGFSEDAGRVLATFIYSNARQTSSYLHTGEIMQGVRAIPKGMGDVQDAAQKLASYIMDPQEEAQAIRGLLFAQYLGGSIASAMVNALQPAQVTFPYLSQFVGIRRSAAIMKNAVQDALKKSTGDAKLDAALLKAEDDGIVSPQEIHQLMAQAQGKATLRPGDGTRAGDAMATASNTLARLSTGWGKVFSVAEQFNRRTTFIAAYRAAVEKGLGNPAAFAEKAVQETQFVYNKGNKPAWARGAVGGTLFTFKQYSISYVELLSRTAASGPEGRKAAALMLGVLFLMAGAGGMPGAEDLEDVIDGIAQRVLGLNWQTRQKREEWLTSMFGAGAARFVENGLSGLPWSPTDVSGRLGLGNLIPGTGVFVKKSSYGRDVAEIAGPAGDFARRIAEGAGHLLSGNVMKAAETVSPVAVRNAVIGARMGVNGQYDDASGKKVVDTEIQDAALKAIGFQPYNVARVQDATRQVRQMVVLNTMRESEIADKWAKAIANEDPDGVKDARNELAEWNQANPDAPIRITVAQIRSRVRALKEDKATRMERTSPKEIRAQVARELAGVR